MRQLSKLATTTAAAFAAITLLTACANDDSQAQTASPAGESEPSADGTSPATEYTVLGAPHLTGPGRWGITAFGDPEAPVAVFDVPEGFQGHESWVWIDEGPGEFAQLASWAPTRVPRDPCNAKKTSQPLGPTVGDLTAALMVQRRTTTTKPVPVKVDGHEGVYVELTTPAGFDYETCGPEGMQIWETDTADGRLLGEPVTDRYWILDVDGQRVVVSALTLPTATSETVELITGMAEKMSLVEAS